MIVFAGRETNGFFLRDLPLNEEIEFTGNRDLEILKDFVLKKNYKCIVVDVSEYADDCQHISDIINDFASMTNSKVIAFAPGYSESSKLYVSLNSYGIKNIVNAGNLAEIKEQFMMFYTDNRSDSVRRVIPDNREEPELKPSGVITIALAGAQDRIGTTTQCFQIVKYLTSKGYKTAYLEFNNTDYLKKMKRLFGLSESDFSFEGIDLFSKEQISEVIKNYDYIVYDYGSIKNPSFNQYSFLEKSINILVCGAKPGEIECSTQALSMFQKHLEVIFLFNFVAASDEEDIVSQMGNHKTFFSPLIPDSYSILSEQERLLSKIVSVESRVEPEQKKKSLFKRRNK